MASLFMLRVVDNRLTGQIPTELGALSELELLWLGTSVNCNSNVVLVVDSLSHGECFVARL